MSTKANQQESDIAHIMHVRPWLKGTDYEDITERMIRGGGLQRSTLVEIAVAKVGGYDLLQEDSYDNSDGSDTKSVTVRKRSSGQTYSAKISDISNKTGLLRVQVWEPCTDKFYYFAIPHEVHSIAKNDLEIPFKRTCEPHRNSKNSKIDLWKYQCNTFEEMCCTNNDGTRPCIDIATFDNLFEIV